MPKNRDRAKSTFPGNYDPTSPARVIEITGLEFPFDEISSALHDNLKKDNFWEGLRPILEQCSPIIDIQSKLIKEVKSIRATTGKRALERFGNGLPMLDGSEILKYKEQFHDFATAILRVTHNLKSNLAFDVNLSLPGLMENPEAFITELSEKYNLNQGNIILSINAVYQIFSVHSALQLRQLVEYRNWNSGFCPICAGNPEMGRIAPADGHYYLVCSQCLTEWKFSRIGCPFCGNTDPDKLGHFKAEEYPSYLVNYCKKCNSYIKVSNEKELNRRHLPIYDNLMTLELDSSAKSEGLHPGEIQWGEAIDSQGRMQ